MGLWGEGGLSSDAYPGYRHLRYWDYPDEQVASWFQIAHQAGSSGHVVIMERVTPVWMARDAPLWPEMPRKVLRLNRALTNQVPYVGIPALCWWWVLVDPEGRAIGPPKVALDTEVVIEQAPEAQWFGDKSVRPMKTVLHRVFHDDGSHHHEFFHPYLSEWVPIRWPYG